MIRAAVLALGFAVLIETLGASAATLRTHAVLRGRAVMLSDLFADLKPGQDCEIGPAPAPGKPLLVPASQLAAIAAQYDVDWHPLNTYATASLERPLRLLKRDEILAVLTPALVVDGMPTGSQVGLGVFASPALPADDTAAPEIQSLDYDPQTGRFSSVMQISDEDGNLQPLRISGRVDQSVTTLATTHTIDAGHQLTADDVAMIHVQKASIHGPVLTDIAQLQGLVARQTLAAGVPILVAQLSRPMLVVRGRPVVLRLTNGGLLLTASGTALESGGAGDHIHVLNTSSHAVLVGRIVDAADIAVDPETSPVFVAQAGGVDSLPRVPSDPVSGMPGASGVAQEARYP